MTDATPPVDTPIAVPASPLREQAGQFVRTTLIAVGGSIAGKAGYDVDFAQAAIGLALIAGPLLWGQRRILKTHAQRVTMADNLPDRIARVFGKTR